MNKPTVAIITRTKDRVLLLERAIQSVLGQTYKDYIMVIVNDGGDPGPVDQLVKKHVSQANGRIQVLHNSKSLGMEAASNAGIKDSKSAYIAFHDDDDTWHEDFLKETVACLQSSSNMGVVTASEVIREKIEGDEITFVARERFSSEINTFNLFSLSGVNQFTNNSFVYNRGVFDEIGYYDEKSPVLGDWDFNIRFLRCYNIAFIDKPLAYYHQREESVGTMQNTVKHDGHRDFTTETLNHHLRNDLDDQKLGIGFVANISHQMHIDASKEQNRYEHLLHHIDSVQGSIKVLNDNITALQGRLDHIERSAIRKIVSKGRKLPKAIKKRITS